MFRVREWSSARITSDGRLIVVRAAATATGCKMNISYEAVRNELVQNKALGK